MTIEKTFRQATGHYESGRFQQAESGYKEVLGRAPDHPDALHHLGLVYYQRGRFQEAVDLIKRAVRNNPDSPFYYNSLGVGLNALGKFEEALANYQKAIHLDADYADVHYNIGNTLRKQGRPDTAISSYRRAVQISSNHLGAWCNMGAIFNDQGKPDQAIDCFQQVINQEPGHSVAHNGMGRAFKKLGKLDMALSCYKKALEANPQNEEALINAGSALQDMGLFESARACYGRAVQTHSRYAAPYAGLACMLLSLGELTELETLKQTILAKLDMFLEQDLTRWQDELIYLAPLLSLDEEIKPRLTRFVDRSFSGVKQPFHFSFPDSNSKLKIGYVSPDFGDHPISHVLKGVFSAHDRSNFEIFAYSLRDRSRETSGYHRMISSRCDHFIDLSRLSNHAAADRIASDGIAILVDLCGYMKDARLEILAHRPAPIQIYWLGHGGGLGLSFMDYVIADDVVIPKGEEELYTEKIIRMPEVYHPTDTPPVSDASLVRSDFHLDENVTVFCAFNNPQKINREVFDVWMRILHRVPGSQLWLSNPKQSAGLVQNLRMEAQTRGIDPTRLVFAERVPDKSQHFARHRLADLFLDTFSYNASTTAIDSLWAGLPIVTCPGKSFYSRICSSFLTHVGLEDMICSGIQEYEEKSVALAGDKGELCEVKKRLWRNMSIYPLFDIPRFAAHLEKAYRMAWKGFKSGNSPRSFKVPALPRP